MDKRYGSASSDRGRLRARLNKFYGIGQNENECSHKRRAPKGRGVKVSRPVSQPFTIQCLPRSREPTVVRESMPCPTRSSFRVPHFYYPGCLTGSGAR